MKMEQYDVFNKDIKEDEKNDWWCGNAIMEIQKSENLRKRLSSGDSTVTFEIIEKGQELFNGNCKQCHSINESVVGPALAKVTERRTVKWLINFIKFPQKTIQKGDKYAVALYNQYNQFMPNHDFMTDEEIKAILSYITNESQYAYVPW